MDLYSEIILDHYQHPHHSGKISNPTIKVVADNPLCGDNISLQLKIKKNIVQEVGFIGTGCAISQAAMSLLADKIQGKKIFELKKITSETVHSLLNVPISPGRIKCALLGFSVLQQALKKLK